MRDPQGRFTGGGVGFWAGKTRSDKTKKAVAAGVKKLWADPEYRKHMSEVHKGQHSSPATEFKFIKGKPKCLDCGKLLINYTSKYCKRHVNVETRSPGWTGNNVGYGALHAWVRKYLGTPSICWYCKITTAKKYHWANVSGEYKREKTDWYRLCVSCHSYYDKNPEKRQQIRQFLERLI